MTSWVVNGVELTMDSTLATLRAGLTFYNLSTSGSKQKCFTRLANYQKQQELEIITAAANQAQREDVREPQAPKLAVPPSEKEQQQHALTHLPFADWCPSCVLPSQSSRPTHGGWKCKAFRCAYNFI